MTNGLLLGLAAALGVAQHFAPPSANVIGVEAASDGTPLILLGITATGSEAGRAALEREARTRKFAVQRLPRDQVEETMVLFPPNSSRAEAVGLLRRAQAGKFGALELEVVVVSAAAARDGIDFSTEVTAEPTSYIVLPRP